MNQEHNEQYGTRPLKDFDKFIYKFEIAKNYDNYFPYNNPENILLNYQTT
jgi:hypothetical protein